EYLFEIGDEQQRPHVLFIKEIAMCEVAGVQFSETFAMVADDEDHRIVQSGFTKAIHKATQHHIGEMQSVVEARRFIFVNGFYGGKSGRDIIWMMGRIEIDHREEWLGSVLRPRESAVRDFPIVDAPAVEGVVVPVGLRHALRNQLLVEGQPIVEPVHIFAVEECGGEKAIAVAATLEFARECRSQIAMRQFLEHTAPRNDLAPRHDREMSSHGAGKRSIDGGKKYAVAAQRIERRRDCGIPLPAWLDLPVARRLQKDKHDIGMAALLQQRHATFAEFSAQAFRDVDRAIAQGSYVVDAF